MMPNTNSTLLNQEALLIFTIIHGFVCTTDARGRSAALDSFPQSFDSIPWRRVYKLQSEAQNDATAAYMAMDHWEPSELPFGGAGSFWCFTVLVRIGENVSRKTVDGKTWSSKSGRGPKKGFPDQIRVDNLVISGRAFDMLELTFNQEKPTVALCKIRRKGNSAAASPRDAIPNIFSPEASTSQLQVMEDHFLIREALIDEMPIDQPQGQLEGIAQQHHMLPDSTADDVIPVDHTAAQEFETVSEFDRQQGSIRSTGPDDDSPTIYQIFQDAVSGLHRMTWSFGYIAIFRRDRARRIALEAQNVMSSVENELNLLGINAEQESTMPRTSSSTNPAAPAPETTTQDEFPDQEQLQPNFMGGSYFDVGAEQLPSYSMEESYFDVGAEEQLPPYFMGGRGNGANSGPDQAMNG